MFIGGARKKTKHTYVAIINKVYDKEDDGDYNVVFLVQNGIQGDTFTLNEEDESVIDFSQIKAILPQPQAISKGLRVIYQFPCNLNDELK